MNTYVIIGAVIVLGAVRQMRPAAVNTPRDLYKMPVLLTGAGLLNFHSWAPHSPVDTFFFVVSAVLAAGVGFVRGSMARVWREGGVWYTKGTVLTLAMWFALIVVKVALGFVQGAIDGGKSGPDMWEIMTFIGLCLLSGAAVLSRRTVNSTTVSAASYARTR
ncbi:hypothetical protein [Streptomyces sp. NPDC059918]|uniref:hypothetical protein n=1 Tax=unclassified Streptomyces TaxID=2593676 RepID=UPI0036585C02